MSFLSLKKNTLYIFSIIAISLLLRIFFISAQDLIIEEAYYWNYALHLDFGYLDHPPLVAVLIKLSTTLFGINEFGVRFPAIICWFITAYFSYRLTELIHKGAGLYALLLLSILPNFFIFSLLITPDTPLIACWSAGLYMLYRALCCEEPKAWYYAGMAIGIGFLAKYTIVLLILTTGIYLLAVPKARFWFLRKEPYIAIVIMLLFFSPVIYWNAMHDWASFVFQSTRRFQSSFHFTFHYLVGILLLFLTPVGMVGFGKLLKKHPAVGLDLDKKTINFFRYYVLFPLAVFAVFSLTRELKFDWIAPIPLALIPWFAMLVQNKTSLLRKWFFTSGILLVSYTLVLFCIAFGRPEAINQKLFNKEISWDDLTRQLYKIATPLQISGNHPVFISIDSYGLNSELTFYQAKQWQHDKIHQPIPVRGADIFSFNSLMFNFWYGSESLQDKTIILIGRDANALYNPSISRIAVPLSPVIMIWGHSQGKMKNLRPYYYQLVRLKPT